MKIETEHFYPVDKAKLWHALTDADALAEWLMPNDFQLIKGHEFTFSTTPRGNFDGIVNCQVLDFRQEESVSYSWLGGKMKQPTTVTWILEEREGGTLLKLKHDGFEGFNGWMIKTLLGLGWRYNLLRKNLKQFILK